MSDPYVGEIQAFAFSYGSSGINYGAWLPCNGQILSIAGNTVLYSLIGTLYGGNGQTTFGLPNLNGRTAIGMGQGRGLTNRSIGEQIGQQTVTLDEKEMPYHSHGLQLGSAGAPSGKAGPGAPGTMVLLNPSNNGFDLGPADTFLSTPAVQWSGSGAPHQNMQPYLAMYWCIATQGIYPSFGDADA